MHRLPLVLLALLTVSASAQALTIRDVIELTRAGVGDEVLLALIEVDRGIYAIDPETMKALKEAGVGERVMVALVRSGRTEPAPPAVPPMDTIGAEPPQPQVVVIDHQDAPERVREVYVPVPVYMAVPVVGSRPRHGHRRPVESTFVPFQSGPPRAQPAEPPKKKEPVYWGFGGKLRPDAWKPGH